ncbi:MAG: hypothetical protein DMF63_18775 [Acidobacteria bacterium]|nr:MAG: hypothetical protein DMF63_18775 [Acidobacteriota bacterium]
MSYEIKTNQSILMVEIVSFWTKLLGTTVAIKVASEGLFENTEGQLKEHRNEQGQVQSLIRNEQA